MEMFNRLRSWLRAVVYRSAIERDMDAELRFHVDAFAQDLMRRGVSEDDAVRQARIEQAREKCREVRKHNVVEVLVQAPPSSASSTQF